MPIHTDAVHRVLKILETPSVAMKKGPRVCFGYEQLPSYMRMIS